MPHAGEERQLSFKCKGESYPVTKADAILAYECYLENLVSIGAISAA